MFFHGSIGLVVLWSLFVFSACTQRDRGKADRLNDMAYVSHYSNLDSTLHYADSVLKLDIDDARRAEALNNIAFVDIMRMDYERADSILNTISSLTDNQVELLVADIQQMRLCQRMSRNREFYDYRERAQQRINRIREEENQLDSRLQRRMVYAESEFAIVSSTYYYYVGLMPLSASALNAINPQGEVRRDTAQYLYYLYNVGAGGILNTGSTQVVQQQEIEKLIECYMVSRKNGYKYLAANSLQSIAEHLLDPADRTRILEDNPGLRLIEESYNLPDSLIPGYMTEKALTYFVEYGDVYQIAGGYRSLASCFTRTGDFETAIYYLNMALKDKKINQAPDLVASIREQMSVAYSAVNDKQASDYNRNMYLDLQENTRQDRYYESRAAQLEATSSQLNLMIMVVIGAIILLVFLLWLFNHLSRRERSEDELDSLLQPLRQWQKEQQRASQLTEERIEEINEERQMCEMRTSDYARQNLENRAKMSLINSVTPFIDRIINEVRMLMSRPDESPELRQERYDYILQLTDKINEYNALLTEWIQMRKGKLSLHIESFPVADVFDIVRKGKTSFNIKGVTLDVAESTAVVKADRALTLFMINTLADNARKFTPANGKVSIYAEEHENYVEISVKDTGEGMTKEVLDNVINSSSLIPNSQKGFGFGLLNCRGIIEKYKKMSQRFAVCLLSAESEKGRGSRFYFRLPKGAARLVLALFTFALSFLSPEDTLAIDAFNRAAVPTDLAESTALQKAAAFADSAYYSNIEGTYERTLFFADSCRIYLNEHYVTVCPGGKYLLMRQGNSDLLLPELKWLQDNVPTYYDIILDMRNESAVACLALHRWKEYGYNNEVYTRLFKELSADTSLPAYCKMMRKQQTDKNIAMVILIIVFLMILPAYYLLYYRHRLYYRFCVEKVKDINAILAADTPSEEKLDAISRITDVAEYPERLIAIVDEIRKALADDISLRQRQNTDVETATDELHRAEYECNQQYISNSIIDNCLSTLKHETMYYPSRIRQLVSSTEELDQIRDLVAYYRDIYSILSQQAMRQFDRLHISLSVASLDRWFPADESLPRVIVNVQLLDMLFDLLRKQNGGDKPALAGFTSDREYVTLSLSVPRLIYATSDEGDIFAPSVAANIPFLLMRQVVRDISETTNRRGCGIWMNGEDVTIRLPIEYKSLTI
ncbi:MAG: DUF5112 domain-containing protein [Prevotella sp.]